MYGIYRKDSHDPELRIVGFCHTKIGARRACRHFLNCYARENGNYFCRVEYRKIESYAAMKVGYMLLNIVRNIEERKLFYLEQKYSHQSNRWRAQAQKVASLY